MSATEIRHDEESNLWTIYRDDKVMGGPFLNEQQAEDWLKSVEALQRTVRGDQWLLDSEPEAVDHPAHYNSHPTGVECIDIVEHMTFNLGNAVKYIWRVGLKPGESDIQALEKARWYVDREIQRLGP